MLCCLSVAGPPIKRAPAIPGLFSGFVERILRSMPDHSASTSQICAALLANPAMAAQLQPEHFVARKGQKLKPRWVWTVSSTTVYRVVQASLA